MHLHVGFRGMDIFSFVHYFGPCLTVCSASILSPVSSLHLGASDLEVPDHWY